MFTDDVVSQSPPPSIDSSKETSWRYQREKHDESISCTQQVCDPQGELLYEAPETAEAEAVVDIDLHRSEQVRRWWSFLRDRRIEDYGGLTKRFLD